MYVAPPAKIAILGAGPVGLEATLYARYLGYQVDLLEQSEVGSGVASWSHVSMFSPWRINCSSLGLAALAAQSNSFRAPDPNHYPTGRQWLDEYLLPLANSDLVVDSVRTNTRVVAIGRQGYRKTHLVSNEDRSTQPFQILTVDAGGHEQLWDADAVIDTTGTGTCPRYLGVGGIPAIGELATRSKINYQWPDILGQDRNRYAGKSTLVVGSGYSAATNIVALARLAQEGANTQITWLTHPRNSSRTAPMHRFHEDRLAARDALAVSANQLATTANSPVTWLPRGTIVQIEFDSTAAPFSVQIADSETGERSERRFDQVIGNVGFRPDREIYRELQVHECYATEGPYRLAAHLCKGDTEGPTVGPTTAPATEGAESGANGGQDCLDQICGPAESLLSPEPNFFILGAKSYGRRSDFLFSLGLAQIRTLFSILGQRHDLDLYR